MLLMVLPMVAWLVSARAEGCSRDSRFGLLLAAFGHGFQTAPGPAPHVIGAAFT